MTKEIKQLEKKLAIAAGKERVDVLIELCFFTAGIDIRRL
jgi:hypothetical protein